MKTVFADPDYARKVAVLQQQSLNVFPPAILYTKTKIKIESKTDILKDQYQKIWTKVWPTFYYFLKSKDMIFKLAFKSIIVQMWGQNFCA